jgi:hypothetical protein
MKLKKNTATSSLLFSSDLFLFNALRQAEIKTMREGGPIWNDKPEIITDGW